MKSLIPLYLTILILLAITVVTQTLAQETGDSIKVHYNLKETVITGNYTPRLFERTPEVMRIVTAIEIQRMNASSLGEVLQLVAGVSVETGTGSGLPNRSSISLNGFPSNYTLVLVNGVRLLSDHIHTGQNIDLVPLEDVEKIEIIRGAASARYGSDAMGGVVNIVTKTPGNDRSVELFSGAGMHDHYAAGGSIQARFKSNTGTRVFYKYEKNGGLPIKAPTSRIGKTGSERSYLGFHADTRLAKKVGLTSGLSYSPGNMEWTDGPKYSWVLTSYIKSEIDLTERVGVTVTIPYSQWWAQQNNENNLLIQPSLFSSIRIGKRNQLVVGADMWYNEFSRTAISRHSQDQWGLFLQDDYQIRKATVVSGAMRLDGSSDVGVVLSPKFSFVSYPWSFLGFRGAISRGFHAPTVQERYEIAYGHGGTALRFGNPDLKSEYSLSGNVAIEVFPFDGMQITLSGCYNQIDNMIVPVYQGSWVSDSTKDVWMRQNIAKAEIWEAELSLRADPIRNLSLFGSYNYSKNRNLETNSILPYYPGSKINVGIHYILFANKPSSLAISVVLTSAFNRSAWSWKPDKTAPRDDPGGLITPLKDYQMLDAGITYRYKSLLEVNAKASNILGQEVEKLDDAYTLFKGEVLLTFGIKMKLSE